MTDGERRGLENPREVRSKTRSIKWLWWRNYEEDRSSSHLGPTGWTVSIGKEGRTRWNKRTDGLVVGDDQRGVEISSGVSRWQYISLRKTYTTTLGLNRENLSKRIKVRVYKLRNGSIDESPDCRQNLSCTGFDLRTRWMTEGVESTITTVNSQRVPFFWTTVVTRKRKPVLW